MVFNPFVGSSGQPPRPVGQSQLIRKGQFQVGGAPPAPPQAPAQTGGSTFGDFLRGGASPFGGGSEMTDGIMRNFQLMRKNLNPGFARPLNEIGLPAQRDFTGTTNTL